MSAIDVTIYDPIAKAVAGGTIGAPLTLRFDDETGFTAGSVCIFMGDHALAERIAAAVNKAIADHANQQEEALAS